MSYVTINFAWEHLATFSPHRFKCGHCNSDVAPNHGYKTNAPVDRKAGPRIYICHVCNNPTLLHGDRQVPGAPYGDQVLHLPVNVESLYGEARQSMSVSAYTGAAMLCRKVLMNVAVSLGATENKSFAHYVGYLSDNNYIPPNAKGWIDQIRKKGNEATHEIHLTSRDEAEELINFTEMLLKIVYEFPGRAPGGVGAATSGTPPATPAGP